MSSVDVFAGGQPLGAQPPSIDSVGYSAAPQPGLPGTGGPEQQETYPLRALVERWLKAIELANEHKKKKFTRTADEIMKFLRGGRVLSDYLWGTPGNKGVLNEGTEDGDNKEPPTSRFTMNKVAEVLQLFAPTLYYNNPTRIVSQRKLEPVPAEIFALLGMAPQGMPEAAELWQTPPTLLQMLQAQAQAQATGNMQPVMAAQQQQAPMMMQAQMQSQIVGQDDQAMQTIAQTRAALLSDYLNYTPNALDLKTQSRRVIDECLLKGMGVWWTEIYQPPGHQTKAVGSFYDTIDNLLLDPDVQTIEECTWIARKCTHPIWEVEQTYGLPPGSLDKAKVTVESAGRQADMAANASSADQRMQGKTNDLITYWKIYSKMGMGGRMSDVDPSLKAAFDGFGDNVFLVVAQGIPYPLNLPNSIVQSAPKDQMDPEGTQTWAQNMQSAVEWPIPFWAANNGWPFTPLAFHEVPNNVWPMSHIAPGLGELKWINECFSWLAAKVRSSCTTIIAVAKGFDEQEKRKLQNPGDNRVVEVGIDMGEQMDINKIIQALQMPPFHADIYNVLDRVEEAFDKRIGLSELLYGMGGGATPRSATDVQVKQQNSTIRLKDMANKVEDAMAAIARKEAFAARWMLDAADIAPVLGNDRAKLWQQLVQTADVDLVTLELDYRIEAGSTQKPDNQQKIDQSNAAVQTWAPLLTQWAEQFQQVGPINALISFWCKAFEIDPGPFQIHPPPPPPMPMPAPGQQQGPPGHPPQGGPPGQPPPHPGPQLAQHTAPPRAA